MKTESAERSSKYELLRIAAMLLIVLHHYICHGVRHSLIPDMSMAYLSGLEFNRTLTSFLIMGGGIGNGIFFMLTGFFMFNKEYEFKRILKLIAQVYFYSIALMLVYYAVRHLHIYKFPELKCANNTLVLLNSFLPFSAGLWWFIQAYTLLFLFVPVLNVFLSKLTSRQFLVVLLLLWILWFNPSVLGFTYQKLQMAVVYYVLGAYIRKTEFKINKWISLILFCVCWISYSFIDLKNNLMIINKTPCSAEMIIIYSKLSGCIITPLAVLFAFEFFNDLQIKNNRFINAVASTTFGIYLIHDSPITRDLLWNKVFHCLDIQYESNMFPALAAGTVIVLFVSCSIIDYLRQCLIERKINSVIYSLVNRFFQKEE